MCDQYGRLLSYRLPMHVNAYCIQETTMCVYSCSYLDLSVDTTLGLTLNADTLLNSPMEMRHANSGVLLRFAPCPVQVMLLLAELPRKQ
jgi:hypothetical protein